jgi:phosphoribosylanthranilate isomerase
MKVKICGNNTIESALAAEGFGADMLGFIFFERSPRNISYEQAAEIAGALQTNITKVAVTVNATDDELAQIISYLKPEYIQLHGSESVERASEVKKKFGVKTIKALAVATATDIALAKQYDGVVDYIMFDAKPPKDATRPGGNAISFDWNLLKEYSAKTPYILAGGLNIENVSDAIAISGAQIVDVVSGVESSPGVKDIAKIESFISKAKHLRK